MIFSVSLYRSLLITAIVFLKAFILTEITFLNHLRRMNNKKSFLLSLLTPDAEKGNFMEIVSFLISQLSLNLRNTFICFSLVT